MYKKLDVDINVEKDFDASVSHPSCVGYAFVERPPVAPPTPPEPLPDKATCEYCDQVSVSVPEMNKSIHSLGIMYTYLSKSPLVCMQSSQDPLEYAYACGENDSEISQECL